MSGGDVDFSRGAYNACQRGDATKQQQQSAASQIILLHAEIGRLKALVEWRPIETAPKDGTEIILGAPEQEYQGKPVAARSTVGHWTTDEECREQVGDCGGECRCPEYKFHDPYWISWDGGFTEENPPTNWMPLPTHPMGASL